MGVGRGRVGDACLLTKENKWDKLSRPAPPRHAWTGAGGGVSREEGAGLSFTLGPSAAAAAAAGAEGRGLAPPAEGEEPGRWWGRVGGARGRASRGVSYVARQRGREKERSLLGRDWGTELRERASEGGSERTSVRTREGRWPLVPERPRIGVKTVGERGRAGKKKGRRKADGGWWRW